MEIFSFFYLCVCFSRDISLSQTEPLVPEFHHMSVKMMKQIPIQSVQHLVNALRVVEDSNCTRMIFFCYILHTEMKRFHIL